MRTGRLPAVALGLVALTASACGGGGGGGGGLPATEPSPGTSSDTLNVFVTLECPLVGDSSGASALANCPVFAYVSVEEDLDGNDVDDATVVLNGVTLASDGNGTYQGTVIGYTELFELDVTRGSDFLTGAAIPGPADFEVSLDPDPPAVNTEATVTWTSSVPAQSSLVYVYQGFSLQTYQGQIDGDDGTELLPGSTFPAAGEYRIDVGRADLFGLAGPNSRAVPVLSHSKTVTVE